MLTVDWDASTGWSSPRIHPHSPISLDPSAVVFHYGTEVFEGMKVRSLSSSWQLIHTYTTTSSGLQGQAGKDPHVPSRYEYEAYREVMCSSSSPAVRSGRVAEVYQETGPSR
eukprot:Partr_v1_DN25852_c0_g1_i2_m2844